MAPPRKQASHKHYSEEAIIKCIQSIDAGKTLYSACKEFGVPMSTIRYRMSEHWQNKSKPGPQSVLSAEEERNIADWLCDMQDRGFPVTRRALLFKLKEFLAANPDRVTPFRNDRPGRKWLRGFMRRNPGFSFRTPEAVSTASSRVSEKDIRGWFQLIDNWLTKNGLREILDDPTRVFNADETSFYLHPKSKEVIARTGSRNVYEAEQAAGKQNVTVMFAFGAKGVIVHPHVILPGKRLRQDVVQSFPAEWGLGQSERGWMDTPNFQGFILKTFHPFLVQQGVIFPVILFVDGHASHNGLEVADLCQSLGIELICLYPNTTHITQPADVAVFKPLKNEWKRSVEDWRFENPGCALTTLHFGEVLRTAVEKGIKSTTIQNGFRVCGLQPFDPNAVDYSKCIAKTTAYYPIIDEAPGAFVPSDAPQESIQKEPDSTTGHSVTISMDRIIEAYDFVGANTIAKIEGDVNRLSREERVIHFFYREFVRPHIDFHDLTSSEGKNITCGINPELDGTHNTEPLDDRAFASSCMDPNAIQLDFDATFNIDPLNGNAFASSISMDIDISNCEIVQVEDTGTLNNTLPLVEDTPAKPATDSLQQPDDIGCAEFGLVNQHAGDQPEVGNSAQLDYTESDATSNNNKSESSEDLLKDATNKPQATKRCRLSEVLKLPLTPRRGAKHRNYKRPFHPVLTAGERTEAIRKQREQKEKEEQQKKRKAEERREAKEKREEAKRARMEEREKNKKEGKPKKPKGKVKKELVMMRN